MNELSPLYAPVLFGLIAASYAIVAYRMVMYRWPARTRQALVAWLLSEVSAFGMAAARPQLGTTLGEFVMTMSVMGLMFSLALSTHLCFWEPEGESPDPRGREPIPVREAPVAPTGFLLKKKRTR